MNQILPLKGKKINKLEHIGSPLSSEEMARREERINEIKMEAIAYSSGVPLDALHSIRNERNSIRSSG